MYIHLYHNNNLNYHIMKNEEYATVKKISKNTWAVIDSANQCRFCTDTERKANNFLNRLLKMVNAQSVK